MKSNSRSGREILGKVAGIFLAPFFIIFLILFGILSLLVTLFYCILTKFCENVKLPRTLKFLFDDVDDTFYEYDQYQSGYIPDEFDSKF